MAFRNILCATDLGEGGAAALREASALARDYRARLEVLRVAPPPGGHVLDPQRLPSPYSAAIQADAAALAMLRASVSELIGETVATPGLRVEHGSPGDVIVEQGRALGADLIVVGAHETAGGRAARLGAVADHVLRHAGCAVLVARAFPLRGAVLAATDFSEAAQRAVRVAAEEARRRGVGLTVLHSVGMPEEALVAAGVPAPGVTPLPGASSVARLPEIRREAQARLAKIRESCAPVPCEVVVTDWEAGLDILEQAERQEAQLIVLGGVGRTGFERLMLGSVAEEIARSARCPVLAIP